METLMIVFAILLFVLTVAFIYEIYFTYRDGGLWK